MEKRRSRVKPKKGMWFVALMAFVISISLFVSKHNLEKKSALLEQEREKIEAHIENAKEKSKQLAEQEEYMKTDEFAEEVAREKLGMVKDNEILFKAKDN